MAATLKDWLSDLLLTKKVCPRKSHQRSSHTQNCTFIHTCAYAQCTHKNMNKYTPIQASQNRILQSHNYSHSHASLSPREPRPPPPPSPARPLCPPWMRQRTHRCETCLLFSSNPSYTPRPLFSQRVRGRARTQGRDTGARAGTGIYNKFQTYNF